MINPQKENGYTAIANEILEKLCSYRLSGEEMKLLLTVIRKTYGFQKKEDHIAISQFMEMTGMKKSNCQRAITKLKNKGILVIKKDNQTGNIYLFNKHFDEWEQLSKKITTKKEVIKKDNQRDSKLITRGPQYRGIQKNNIKENTKDIGKVTNAPPTPKENAERFFRIVEAESVEFEEFISKIPSKIPPVTAREEIKNFCRYWTELTQGGRKQRWECQKTFEVQKRLATWFNNLGKWSHSGSQNNKRRAFV